MKPAAVNYFIYALAAVIIAITFYSGIWDPDFFWHLATGRWIVEHRAIPSIDPFGVYADLQTDRSLLILRGYWLCQTIYYLIYNSFGYNGFAFLKSLVFVFLFAGQFRLLQGKKVSIGITVAQALVAYAALLDFRADRPQMFSYLGVVLVLLLLELRLYRWLPLLMIIWANMHGAFLVGAVIIATYSIFEVLQRIKSSNIPLNLLPWGIAGIAAAGINPNGFTAFGEVLSMQGGAYQNSVFEYISPLTLALKYNDIYWLYFLVLLSGVVLVFLLRNRIPHQQAAVFFSLAIMSLSAGRYMPFLFIVGSLYLAMWLSPFLGEERKSFVLAICSLALMGFICFADIKEGRGFSKGIEQGRYPEKALKFIDSARESGNIFCIDYWGGYILWRFPGQHISIDGRGLSTDQHLRNLALYTDEKLFAGLAASPYEIILTSAFNLISGEWYQLWQFLAASPAWRLAYADDIALVFVRSDTAIPGISNPANVILDHALQQAVSFTKKYPGTVFHWTNLAEIHLLRYEVRPAVNALKQACKLAPNDPDIASRLSLLERALNYSK